MSTSLIWFFGFGMAPLALAQGQQGGEDVTGSNVVYEVTPSGGQILPNQIPGMTEIIGLGGARFGFRVAPRVFVETGLLAGNGEGVLYRNLFSSVRVDIPIETLVGVVFGGVDAINYEGVDKDLKTFGAAHVGGGVQALLGGNVWFRSNMKFNVNPGTAMIIDFGLSFRF
ncbi:MAG: hypothetical protein AAF202_03985 [Pseudomonadota bacterium]